MDRALTRLASGWSRTWIQRRIRDGGVRLNGAVVTSTRIPVASGTVVALDIPDSPQPAIAAETFAFPILFEDAWLLVINKPAGVVVHPAVGNRSGTVVNALLGRYPCLQEWAQGTGERPGIVHRLDKNTSGCLMVAKTPLAMSRLSAALAARKVHKTYLALVRGEVRKDTDKLVTLIGRHPVHRQKMAVVSRNGKEAVTIYRKVAVISPATCEKATLLEVDILTGRTHQIRVHLASIGHPVLGDETYGGKSPSLASRQMLHAWRIDFPHPSSGERICCRAPVPDDMREWLRLAEGVNYER